MGMRWLNQMPRRRQSPQLDLHNRAIIFQNHLDRSYLLPSRRKDRSAGKSTAAAVLPIYPMFPIFLANSLARRRVQPSPPPTAATHLGINLISLSKDRRDRRDGNIASAAGTSCSPICSPVCQDRSHCEGWYAMLSRVTLRDGAPRPPTFPHQPTPSSRSPATLLLRRRSRGDTYAA